MKSTKGGPSLDLADYFQPLDLPEEGNFQVDLSHTREEDSK